MPRELLAFCAVAALFSVSPGPDTVLVVNRALRNGRRTALATALGSASGLLAWGLASALGVAAIVSASATMFSAMRLAGAAYLVLLGLQALRRAHRSTATNDFGDRSKENDPPRWTFRQGLLTNLLNPKAGVFFVAVLPGFVAPHESVLATTSIFAAVDAGVSLLALFLYTMVPLGAGTLLRRPVAGRVIDRLTGTVMVGLGIRLATEPR